MIIDKEDLGPSEVQKKQTKQKKTKNTRKKEATKKTQKYQKNTKIPKKSFPVISQVFPFCCVFKFSFF